MWPSVQEGFGPGDLWGLRQAGQVVAAETRQPGMRAIHNVEMKKYLVTRLNDLIPNLCLLHLALLSLPRLGPDLTRTSTGC
jgi:hypothetical protein